jgi:hypothetical protein
MQANNHGFLVMLAISPKIRLPLITLFGVFIPLRLFRRRPNRKCPHRSIASRWADSLHSLGEFGILVIQQQYHRFVKVRLIQIMTSKRRFHIGTRAIPRSIKYPAS